MDGEFVGSDENSKFDKFARRPLSHIYALRGTGTSMCIAILDASVESGPGGRPQVGRKGAGQDARHNLSRRAFLKPLEVKSLRGFSISALSLHFSRCS